MIRTVLAALLLLPACNPEDSSGTSVGNPGLFALRAAPTSSVEVVDGFLGAEGGLLTACDGTEQAFDLEPPGFGDVRELPSGDWCSLELQLPEDEGLELEIRVDSLSEDPHGIALPLDSITVSAHQDFTIAPDAEFVLQLGSTDWLTEARFELDGDEVVLVDGQEDALAEVVLDASALYADPSGDSELDDDEREAGPIAAADPDTVPADDEGGGSAADPACDGTGAALVPLCLLPFGRRRYAIERAA